MDFLHLYQENYIRTHEKINSKVKKKQKRINQTTSFYNETANINLRNKKIL